jgi:hypothetical protein
LVVKARAGKVFFAIPSLSVWFYFEKMDSFGSRFLAIPPGSNFHEIKYPLKRRFS